MSDKATAYAQIILSVVFIVGYFIVLGDFIHGRINVPVEWKETLQTLLSLLTAAILQIVGYWFQRHRQSTPDAA